MKIENWETAGSLGPLYQELQQLGLETNIAELEAFGYTIVPPKKIGPERTMFLRPIPPCFGLVQEKTKNQQIKSKLKNFFIVCRRK